MKKITLSLLLVALSTVLLAKDRIKPTEDMGKIARVDATITASRHYRQHAVDDEISTLLFNEYFKTLDPNKIYFTQQDIDSFDKYKSKLDDQLNYGQVEFAFEVYNLFLEKAKAYKLFVTKQLKEGFDFHKKESFVIDRSKEPWAKDEAELKDIWRKKIKNDILTYRLMEKAKDETKETLKPSASKDNNNSKTETAKPEAAKTEVPKPEATKTATDKAVTPKPDQQEATLHKSWVKKPEERLLKRVDQYLNYLEKNEPIDVLEIYLSSFKKVYDPHSSYMAPDTVEDFNISMKLSLVGIGAVLTTEDGYTKIVRLIPGGPADADGSLKPEDRIIAVAQEDSPPVDIIDMPLSKVVKLIRGNKDTKVHLTVLDGNQGIHAIPKVVTITRNTVKLKEQEAKGEIKTLESNGKKLKIGVITLPSFYLDFEAAFKNEENYKSSTRDIKQILKKFNNEKIDGLVLDIRSNGGGSLVEAIELTGLFINEGPVVQIRDQSGKIDKKYDPDDEIYFDKPMVVLTNCFSASASEIFAGAIQDYGRGIIVGDSHTHGKGTVQTIFDLDPFLNFLGCNAPAGSIKLTTAKFYRISGSSTQEKGVIPDIIYPSFSDSMKLGEKYLDYALPWDSIEPDKYDVYNKNLGKMIPELRKMSEKRQNDSKEFNLLKKDIDFFNKIKNRKVVSLNEEERWTSYQNEKKLVEEQAALMKLDQEDPKSKDKKSAKNKDIYLNETLQIIRDYIEMNNKKNKS